MNFDHLIKNALFASPAINTYYNVDSNWSHIINNVFGVDEIRPRVGTFTTPWPNQPTIFPVIDSTIIVNKSMSDLLDNRAIELSNIAKTNNKKLVVMWSGGIDSTAVISAFIKNLSVADLDNIIVCASTASIAENEYFYRTQISNKFRMLHLYDLDISNNFLNDHILITGDPGDSIVGPSTGKYLNLIKDNLHLVSWNSNKNLLYRLYSTDQCPTFAKWWVDKICNNLYEVQGQGMFTQVISIADWHWWQYYNFKHHGTMMRPFIRHKKNDKEIITQKNLQDHFNYSFLGHPDFQLWSCNNLHNLLPSINEHKKTFKDYILELDHNTDYYNNKIKIASWQHKNHGVMFADQNCVIYRYNEPGIKELVLDSMTKYQG